LRPCQAKATFGWLFYCPPRAGFFMSGAVVRKVRIALVIAVVNFLTAVITLITKLI
jgi:hypothetical protein